MILYTICIIDIHPHPFYIVDTCRYHLLTELNMIASWNWKNPVS
jgi:hypothetical protein